jgi:hypothetical protein
VPEFVSTVGDALRRDVAVCAAAIEREKWTNADL